MNLFSLLLFSMLCCFHSTTLVLSAKRGRFELTDSICEDFNKTYVTLNQCNVIKDGKGNTWNMRGRLHQIFTDCRFRIKLLRKINKNYQPFLYNDEIDICYFLLKIKNHFFWDLVRRNVQRFSNLNHTCPYEGDVILEGFRIDQSYAKLVPLPLGSYKIECHVSVPKALAAVITVVFNRI